MIGSFAPLRDRNLALLASSRFISLLGTGIGPIAIAFGVLALPGGDATSLGIVLLAGAIPQVVFMLLGGVLADRFPRRLMLIVAETLAGVIQLAVAWLFLSGTATIPLLAVCAAIEGVSVALLYPALTGIVPEVVDDDHLQSANALLRLASNLARILGVALGGVLVATIGPGWAVAIDGATFLMAAVLISALRLTPRSPALDEPADEGTLRQLRTGWREFISRRWIVSIVATFSLANMGVAATLGVLGPVRANESFGGAGPWSVVLTAFSIGTVFGVILAVRVRPSRPMLVGVLAAAVTVVPVASAAVPTVVWVVAAGALVAGVGVDVFSVLWDTALQQHVPAESLSRVASYDWLGSSLFTPVGLALAGPVAAVIGLSGALWVCAGLCAAPLLALLDPQVRRLRPGRPPATV